MVSIPSYKSSSATVNVKVPWREVWPAGMVNRRASPGRSVEKSSASAVASPAAVIVAAMTASDSKTNCGSPGSAGAANRARTRTPG